ncbi:type IA DNA topoisomerase [Clostridium akagii]|uniref:type IA DNA topoisomerase n=1 Tax=Clostridium akagii TaxID=91623 RepID=UPI00047BF1DE|nr:DNA topoisomerase [Clostridium akagii]
MDLILAEKPNVALHIAKALGATNRCNGYFEGNGYIVTFAFGHLFTLKDVKDYDSNRAKWNLENYPFIPGQFQFKLKESKDMKLNKGTKDQFEIINKLSNRKDINTIINATDGDREGEIIAFTIIKATGTNKPIKRLWISSHTPNDVKDGMNNLIDNIKMIPLQEAGLCRQTIDWIIGINFTVLASIKYGNGNILNIGRVIMPTLKIIYDRDIEIKKFKPKEYFQLVCNFKSNNGCYLGLYLDKDNNTKFDNNADIKNIANLIKNSKGIVESKKIDESKKSAQQLFNLSELQGYITNKYKDWTSDKVLKVAQSLYEKTYITYPRTPSRVLNETQISETKNTLTKLVQGQTYEKLVIFNENKTVFDKSKVESHPAITPTYIIASNLNEDETIIYNEIKYRFISQFMPPVIYENTEFITNVEQYKFISKGKTIKDKGWLILYDENEDNEHQVEQQLLPFVNDGDIANIENIEVLSKFTRAPSKHTEKSLLKAMETCNKNTEEDVNNVLSGFQIGTQATRAEVIKKIQDVGYVIKKGKSLNITDIGIKLIEVFPIREIMDLDFTGKLEYKLKQIEEGKYSREEFIKSIIDFTNNSISKIKVSDGEVIPKTVIKNLGICPFCNKGYISHKKGFYGCSNWKEGCKNTISDIILGGKIKETDIEDFIKDATTKIIKGAGCKFKLLLKDKKVKIEYKN